MLDATYRKAFVQELRAGYIIVQVALVYPRRKKRDVRPSIFSIFQNSEFLEAKIKRYKMESGHLSTVDFTFGNHLGNNHPFFTGSSLLVGVPQIKGAGFDL